MGGGTNYSDESVSCHAVLLDRAGNPVAKDDGEGAFNGTLTVPLARFWWPYLMDPDPGYMYTLQVSSFLRLIYRLNSPFECMCERVTVICEVSVHTRIINLGATTV